MRSPKQIEASRKNGAKSRGPTSGRGTQSLQGTFLATTVVLDGESQPRFEALHQTLTDALVPEDAIEKLLISKMVVSHWRLMRLWGLQKALHIHGNQNSSAEDAATRHVLTLIDQSRSSGLLNRFESSCDRQFVRALDRFFRIRTARRASEITNSSHRTQETPTESQANPENPQKSQRIPANPTARLCASCTHPPFRLPITSIG